jgi:hypothetical protein
VQSTTLCFGQLEESQTCKQEKDGAANAALHWGLLLLADGNPFREAAEGKREAVSVIDG